MEPFNWGKTITTLKIINVPLLILNPNLDSVPKVYLVVTCIIIINAQELFVLVYLPISFGGSSATKSSMDAVPISLGNTHEIKTTFTEWLLCTKNDSKILLVLPYGTFTTTLYWVGALLSTIFERENWGLGSGEYLPMIIQLVGEEPELLLEQVFLISAGDAPSKQKRKTQKEANTNVWENTLRNKYI